MRPLAGSIVAALIVATICCCSCNARESSSGSQTETVRNGRLQKHAPKVDPSCGTENDVANKVAVCAKPLMDLLQGTVEKWPRTEEDAMQLCDSYAWSERCIREQSRKCARGIQKTIISTLANSIQRVRKRECARSKAPGIIKTTMCLEKQQTVIHNWMKNATARLNVVEYQMNSGDKKINGLCCMIVDIEKEIKQNLNPTCEEEAKLIVRLYRAVLEDVNDLVCRNPKCKDFLKGYKVPKNGQGGELVAIILRIVFSLENSE